MDNRTPRARLSGTQIEEARTANAGGESLRSIGARMGVHFTTVSKAISRVEAKAAKPTREIVFVSDFKAPTRTYRDLPNFGIDTWDNVNQVRSALSQLDKGQFQQAALMVDAMFADDRISGVWSCRADGLTGLPLEMKTPRGLEADDGALAICDDAERQWQDMAPEQAVSDLLKWGRFLGIGIAEKIYPSGSATWAREMKLKVWHPRFLYWNWSTRTYHLVTQDGVVNLDHEDPEIQRKWVFYAPYGMQRGWVHARVRPLAIPWLVRQWAWRDHARHNEVHGIPIRKVKVPSQWDDKEKERALAEIAQLATESVVRCPVDEEGKGFDLELVEPKGNSYEAFANLASRADTAIAVVLLGQNLTTEITSGGSRAAAQVHDRVRQDVIKSDAESLSGCLRRQVLKDWALYNHGDASLAPWPTWDIVPPQDEQKLGTALRAVMEALKVARETQLPIDFPKLCETFGIPLVQGVEIEEYEDPLVEVAEIKAGAVEEEGDDGKKPPPTKKTSLSAKAGLPAGMVRGQVFADGVKDGLRSEAGPVIGAYLARMLTAIEKATSYEEIRQGVLAAFKDESPADLAALVERATMLAELNGMLAVREDETN